jgi:transaldolase
MPPIEFQTELAGQSSLSLPPEVVAQLPKSGRATVVVLVQDAEHAEWRAAAYEQFMRDDDPHDACTTAIYEVR